MSPETESSSTQEKETVESSDEEIPVQIKTRSDYHSDSEESDEPSRLTQRRRSARSRRERVTAQGRSRGIRGGTRGSTRVVMDEADAEVAKVHAVSGTPF